MGAIKRALRGPSYSNEAMRARAEYLRDWRKRNPDKVKAYNRRYWEKRAAAARATMED